MFRFDSPLSAEVQERFSANKPYTSEDFMKMDDEKFAAVLHHTSTLQRGGAENAMLDIQRHFGGGGYYPFLAEHVGDLYWRSGENARSSLGDFNDVDSKVLKSLSTLNHHRFHRQMEEDIAGIGKPRAMLNELGRLYAQEHAKLPVYNKVMEHASKAAQSLGKMNFGATVGHLETLKPLVVHPDHDKFPHWSEQTPEQRETLNALYEKLAENWKRLHSRESAIAYLKSIGR